MKYLISCCAATCLAALSLGLPAHHATPPARAAGPQADAGRQHADVALPVQFDTDGGELMVARLAFESGNYLLNKARHAEPAAARRLLTQAEQHYRACLAHEGSTLEAAGLFADARRNLEAARKLLAPERPAPEKKPEPAPRVARIAPAPAAPAPQSPRPEVVAQPKPTPKTEVSHDSAAAAEGLMVGPDGVIYHRDAEGR
jgi:hypothetical protein